MIISKGSKIASVFQELIKPSYTLKASTIVSYVNFIKEKGIYIKFDENIEGLFLKNEDVDFTAQVTNYFVTILVSLLEKQDAEISFSDGKIYMGGFEFDTKEVDDYDEPSFTQPHVKFSKEQWAKLERDFKATTSNAFKNPRIADVINFTVHQGALYKTMPSISHWEISKFDATIDEVGLSQAYGHTTKVFGLPHKVWDILKYFDDVELLLSDSRITAKSDGISLRYQIYGSKFNAFLERLAERTEGEKLINVSLLRVVEPILKDSVKNAFEQEEDKNCYITIENNYLNFEVEESARIKFKVDYTGPKVVIPVNLAVLEYVLGNASDNAEIRTTNKSIIVVDGDKYIMMANNGTGISG